MSTQNTAKRPPRRDAGSDYRKIARLEDQLAKRMRFAWAMFVFGIVVGFIFFAVVSMPPVWLGAL